MLTDTNLQPTDNNLQVEETNIQVADNNIQQQDTNLPSEKPVSTNYWPQIQDALSNGYSHREVSSYLQQQLGVPEEEANKQLIQSVQDKMKSAIDSGYTKEEVKDYLISKRYDPSVIDDALLTADKDKKHNKFSPTNWFWPSEEQVAANRSAAVRYGLDKPKAEATIDEKATYYKELYENIHGMYSTTAQSIGGIVDDDMALQARRDIQELDNGIVDMLNENGIQAYISPTSGEIVRKNEQGVEIEIDGDFIQSINNSKFEIGGAVAGAMAGARAGAATGATIAAVAGQMGPQVATPEEVITVPLFTAAGTIIGGAMGAATGRGGDLLYNSYKLKEDLSAELYVKQMKEAAIFDVVGGTIGWAVFKGGKQVGKQVMKAYDFFLTGNTKGAYQALKDNMLINDEQAKEIVAAWEKTTGTTAPGKTFEEKAIGVVVTTQQGAEGLAHYAASKDPQAAMQVVKDIDTRAKDILKLIDTVADENVGKVIKENLAAYKKDVGDFFEATKQVGADSIDGTDFRFDYDKLALQPVMDSIEKSISNPAYLEQFARYSERIAQASDDRTFSGLLSLRETVNNFKYSRTKLKKPDIDALNNVLNKIDGQINKAVKEYMPSNGKEWIKQFSTAKTEYAKMKQLEQNALFKVINRKGVSEDVIRQGLKKYINSIDNTFVEVLDKLPPKTRAKAEGAAVKEIVDRFTLGNVTDKQAVHFPMASEMLKNIPMTTPEAKYLKTTIDEMAKVFRNDVDLSRVSGNIAVPKFQSYLTTDPVVRLKFEVASGIFNFIKTKIPGKQANNLALLRHLEGTLENPMQVSRVDKLIKGLPKESQEEMRSLVKQLQIELTKNPRPEQSFKNMYKRSSTGKFTTSKGAWGEGVYLQNAIKGAGPDTKIIKKEVNMSTLATIEDISKIYGKEITEKDLRTMQGLQKELAERGYKGIRNNDKAMLFSDTVLGAAPARKTLDTSPIKQNK